MFVKEINSSTMPETLTNSLSNNRQMNIISTAGYSIN
uniref:Uncharacterized protein n=1 Tax=Schistosoma haematobium TaxID=6185 RepID=A0A095C7K6_SCHHA